MRPSSSTVMLSDRSEAEGVETSAVASDGINSTARNQPTDALFERSGLGPRAVVMRAVSGAKYLLLKLTIVHARSRQRAFSPSGYTRSFQPPPRPR